MEIWEIEGNNGVKVLKAKNQKDSDAPEIGRNSLKFKNRTYVRTSERNERKLGCKYEVAFNRYSNTETCLLKQ